MSTKSKLMSIATYRERVAKGIYHYDNAFAAFVAARNQTERKYACHKWFRFVDGRKKNLPRSQRYPKRVAAFMDWLDENNIPFIVECLTSSPSGKAILKFNGDN